MRAKWRSACCRADGGSPETSEIAEITVSEQHAFYDFEAIPRAELPDPAALDEEVTDQVHDLARRAFKALDVEGLAREDFFVFGDGRVGGRRGGDDAGFTATSMFPCSGRNRD